MEIGIITVGDELLAGDVENTNATWLARQLTGAGVGVREVCVVPDDVDRIAARVAEFADAFDSVVVTGGLGSTPDDVTLAAVADALDRDLVVDDRARAQVEAAVAAIHEDHPEFEFDVEPAARMPADSDVIPNDAGIAPGCHLANVYVLPGLPSEMKATYGRVADEFSGSLSVRTLYTTTAESHIAGTLAETRDRFDVTVGCYPDDDTETKRIRVSGRDEAAVEAAGAALLDRPDVVTDPGDD